MESLTISERTNEADTDEGSCNPSLPDDLIEDAEKIKGDAIGNTLYSECWVLKTLMKLTQLDEYPWNEELESELCLLWDMTIERDVVDLLMKHDFFSLATQIIQSKPNARLTEMLVGMVGNMCCVAAVRSELSTQEETTETLLELLSTLDSPTLVQLFRLLHSVAWDLIKAPDQPNLLRVTLDNSQLPLHTAFILSSATNEDLLFCILDFLNTLCSATINDMDFSQHFATLDMVHGLVECWNQLFTNWDPCDDFPSKQLLRFAKHWLSTLCSFAGHKKGTAALTGHGDAVYTILHGILKRLAPDTDIVLISCVTILEALLPNQFHIEMFRNLLAVLYKVTNQPASENEDCHLECLSIKDSLENYFCAVLRQVGEPRLNSALSHCDEREVDVFWRTVTDMQPEEGSRNVV